MKYIDGIKDDPVNRSYFARSMFGIMDMCTRLTIRPVKHIPIYEPMTKERMLYLMDTNQDILGTKWVDGQPYEIVTINKGDK